ncbi:MAG: UDP-2,3-diacylglucosamine diphosphatase LpxI [Deltaproteobacteria bacterium]|nr:UDP-2,3-diacylglucosamine diphosphatase LpxI [Deltaproteobacteria bacterium]
MPRIGLIAGNGRFPLAFARTARAQGVEVIAVAHQGETLPELQHEVQDITWIRVGELGRIIETFRRAGIDRVVMAGGIRKETLLEHFAPDERGMRFLGRLQTLGDDTLLRGLADELESEGLHVVESTLFLSSLLTPVGLLTGTPLDSAHEQDVRYGFEVAKAIGRWDIGQTVVIKTRIVLAVEAIEGTDATIRRSGRPGAVVVKVSKPQQDLRFDVPAVGPQTVQSCVAAGIAVLALEAGKTLLLDKEDLLRDAAAAGLTVIGVET